VLNPATPATALSLILASKIPGVFWGFTPFRKVLFRFHSSILFLVFLLWLCFWVLRKRTSNYHFWFQILYWDFFWGGCLLNGWICNVWVVGFLIVSVNGKACWWRIWLWFWLLAFWFGWRRILWIGVVVHWYIELLVAYSRKKNPWSGMSPEVCLPYWCFSWIIAAWFHAFCDLIIM